VLQEEGVQLLDVHGQDQGLHAGKKGTEENRKKRERKKRVSMK
jgi:hypothetical protein